MNTIQFQTVYSTRSTLLAVALQNTLETGGIQVVLAPSVNGAYLDVNVPAEQAYDAQNLLAPEPARGEMLFAFAR
jgi:hypothetical protein